VRAAITNVLHEALTASVLVSLMISSSSELARR